MATARAFSVQLLGIDGQVVQAEADLDAARRRTGLLDRLAAAETTDRIRAAVRNADLPWPARPVTLTTFPATPSSGLIGCDLAWACAVLAAEGVGRDHQRAGCVGRYGDTGQGRRWTANVLSCRRQRVLPTVEATQPASVGCAGSSSEKPVSDAHYSGSIPTKCRG